MNTIPRKDRKDQKDQNARFHLLSTQRGDNYGDKGLLLGGESLLSKVLAVEEGGLFPKRGRFESGSTSFSHSHPELKIASYMGKWQLSTVSTAPTTTTTFISLKKDFS